MSKERVEELERDLNIQSDRLLAMETLFFKYRYIFDTMSEKYPEIILKYHHLITEAEEEYIKTSPKNLK